MIANAWFRYACLLTMLVGVVTILGCTVPGYSPDGSGKPGEGPQCMLDASYASLTAPVLDPGIGSLTPENSPLALGETVSVTIGAPDVINAASATGGIMVHSGTPCVEYGDDASALPVDITANEVGVWSLGLDDGSSVAVDVRQPVDVAFFALPLSNESGQVAVGAHVAILAYLVDRSQTRLMSGPAWKWTLASGNAQLEGDGSNLAAVVPLSAGAFQVAASHAGLTETISFTAVE